MIKKIFAVAAVLPLVACGSGPSESDIATAVKKSIEAQNKQISSVGNMFGGAAQGMAESMKFDVPEVKKLGCKEDGENAYRCDVELTSKQGKNVVAARFVKGSDGWAITR